MAEHIPDMDFEEEPEPSKDEESSWGIWALFFQPRILSPKTAPASPPKTPESSIQRSHIPRPPALPILPWSFLETRYQPLLNQIAKLTTPLPLHILFTAKASLGWPPTVPRSVSAPPNLDLGRPVVTKFLDEFRRTIVFQLDTGISRLRRVAGPRPHIRVVRELDKACKTLTELESILIDCMDVEGLDEFVVCENAAPVRVEKARLRVELINGILEMRSAQVLVLGYLRDIGRPKTW
ncbi:hypothetical protein BJ508DRAFT_419129 [Ascobolus immersus RN42]|uniref:Uncharacterized protein n=1 Tax=Ascobolus immersus RN42 TaxID=1160509 RepID=A0A3N4HMX9_ASCIM|nr:hypothetical protein BJ508DRAFT_419129 [Ascobolus immersus RN42]